MKYYKVTVMRGHTGSKHDKATITFYEIAENMISAIDKARKHGGVKHNKMPIQASEINEAEYNENIVINAYDRAGCRKDKGIAYFLKMFSK